MIRKIREVNFQLKFRKTLNTASDRLLVLMQLEIQKEQLKRKDELKKIKRGIKK